jgi:hypothetical protein
MDEISLKDTASSTAGGSAGSLALSEEMMEGSFLEMAFSEWDGSDPNNYRTVSDGLSDIYSDMYTEEPQQTTHCILVI